MLRWPRRRRAGRSASRKSASARPPALWGLRLTLAGLGFIVVNGLMLVAALNSEANLLFLVFCLSAGVLVFSAVAPVVMVRRIEADRVVPPAVAAGRPFTLAYVLRSRRRWGNCWSLLVCETPRDPGVRDLPWGFVPGLPAGGQVRLELAARCPGRGRINLAGIRIVSRFPFGLFACAVDIHRPAELLIYPVVGRLRSDVFRNRGLADGLASKARENRGDDEFAGVREFREGDNFRWIHWRRSAHTGELVIREHMPLQASHLIILVDPWPENDGKPAGRLSGGSTGRGVVGSPEDSAERIISAAATAACDALERGHRVGLILQGKIPGVLAPAGGRPHRQRLLRELALLTPGAEDPLDALVARIRWTTGWRARCLLCTSRMGQAHRRTLQFLSRRAESVLIAAPGTPWLETVFSPAGDRGSERRAR
ncbi:MAG TPA: DUF58 domain-containing protein [Phycisphaerae bacterium]|nr:DUF58 domain-containing protein [Phycisphaerae bacterium]